MHPATIRASNIKTFGQALQKVRIEHGLSHREVSDRVGQSKQLVRDWEDNIAIPVTQTMKRLYSAFPELRYFTHLLPRFEKYRYMDKANNLLDDIANKRLKDSAGLLGSAKHVTESTHDNELWLPPLAKEEEGFPEALEKVFKPKSFGENLRFLRLQEGMDQTEVGDLLNVTGSAIGHWERNFVSPIRDHLEKLNSLFPQLRNGPQPESKNIAKPDNRVNGYVASSAPLRAVPTAFDVVQTPEPPSPVPPPPPPPTPPPPPKPPEKTPSALLAEAGMEYAKLASEKKRWESEVLQHEIEIEEAKKKVVEAQKKLDEATKAADAAHQRILDIANKI